MENIYDLLHQLENASSKTVFEFLVVYDRVFATYCVCRGSEMIGHDKYQKTYRFMDAITKDNIAFKSVVIKTEFERRLSSTQEQDDIQRWQQIHDECQQMRVDVMLKMTKYTMGALSDVELREIKNEQTANVINYYLRQHEFNMFINSALYKLTGEEKYMEWIGEQIAVFNESYPDMMKSINVVQAKLASPIPNSFLAVRYVACLNDLVSVRKWTDALTQASVAL